MIIKGVFRRYERWNPVHPTSGAFWGMGLGIGCGVGWGPGFGPEAIGYVGAGCGVGFSVGITVAGFGIGLPANYLLEVPYKVILTTGNGALRFVQSNSLLSAKDVARNSWNNVAICLSGLPGETSGRLSCLNKTFFLDKGVDLFDMTSKLAVHTRSLPNVLGTFCRRFFHPGKVEPFLLSFVLINHCEGTKYNMYPPPHRSSKRLTLRRMLSYMAHMHS